MDLLITIEIRNRSKREKIRRNRANLLELRLRSNPFDLPDRRFVQLFRINKVNARILMIKLEPFAEETDIPFRIKFLATLHFYGYGSYQSSIGSNHLFGISQPSTSRCIDLITNLINTYLVNEAISFPNNILDVAEKKRGFFCKYNLPNIIGIIDGCHIPIVGPPENYSEAPGHLYLNRKGFHSLNVLAITDSNLKIIFADARFPGSVHDSGIWIVSPVRKLLKSRFTTPENQSCHILGDSGFPLEPWLFTPLNNTEVATAQKMFNERFLKARNSVEKTFGVIKSRFRCLSNQRKLYYTPEKAAKIVYAIFAVHNLYTTGLEEFLDDETVEEEEENHDERIQRNRNQWHTAGVRVRDRYILNLTN